jgi:hypothetical protein
MRKLTLGLFAVLGCMALILPLAAQEGFPLKGSWLGDWGESTTNRNQVFVVFDWDGKVVSGAINPGTEMITVKNASLTPTPIAPPPGTAAAAPAGGGGGGGRQGRGGAGGGAGAQGAAAGAPAAGAAPAGTAAPAAGGGGRGGGGGQAAPVPALPGAPAAAGAGQGGGARGGNGAGPSAPAPIDWVVHFEGDGKDGKGTTVHYVADGKIENIGLYNRSIVGTWVSGTTKGTFKLTRQ